jgi:hypothetical protein
MMKPIEGAMSCYTRHLGEVMELMGLEDTRENKKLLDEKIRRVLGTDAPCPDIWKQVKENRG